MVLAESETSIIWKVNRWFGLRFGYVFYRLGFSANLLSAVRLILAFLGFYFLSFADSGSVWKPVMGFFIIVWQVNLDFADGAIARAHKKSSDFGEKLDGLGNAASRAAIIILFGYYTKSALCFQHFGIQRRVLFSDKGDWRIFENSFAYLPVLSLC